MRIGKYIYVLILRFVSKIKDKNNLFYGNILGETKELHRSISPFVHLSLVCLYCISLMLRIKKIAY
jgi:hypothetical protein